jgi:hypothetical protein
MLQTYDIRVGTIYFNPAYQVYSPPGTFGTPYHTPYLQLHTTQFFYGSAPAYGWKANMLYPSKRIASGNVPGTGAAPTQGVYTGIPSGCNANGTSGSAY